MGPQQRNTRFFWMMLLLLFAGIYVFLRFVSTGNNCGGDHNKQWHWFPPQWECKSQYLQG